MKFSVLYFIALFAVCNLASAQFAPFYPAQHYEPSLFYRPPQRQEPGLFNFIPNRQNVHTVYRPPTPLGWGRK